VNTTGFRWKVTGTVANGKVSFHVAYTAGNPGYTVDAAGIVAGLPAR